jgi:flagellar protein FlbD
LIPSPESAPHTFALPSDKHLSMIRLTRINHIPLVLNADLIEHVETTPDTVISMTNGQKFVVLESSSDVIRKVIEFRHEILNSGPALDLDSPR